jgi:hypothetical protein
VSGFTIKAVAMDLNGTFLHTDRTLYAHTRYRWSSGEIDMPLIVSQLLAHFYQCKYCEGLDRFGMLRDAR